MSLNQFEWLEDYDDLFEEKIPSQLLQNPLLQKDIWHTIDDLNLKISPHNRTLTLSFKAISPDWFKLLVKLYVLVRAKPGTPSNTIGGFVTYLRGFSKFLVKKSIQNPKRIDTQLFEEFDYCLKAKELKSSSLGHYRTTICNFFDVCRSEKWLDVNTYYFRGKRKRVKPKNDEVEYIPEEVWHQLEENLHYLPEPIQRIDITPGILSQYAHKRPVKSFSFQDNKWDIRAIKPPANKQEKVLIANFETIQLTWFKNPAKHYIYHLCKLNRPISNIEIHLCNLRIFSRYLAEKDIQNFNLIDRSLILDFLVWDDTGIEATKKRLSTLRDFFWIGNIKHWFKIDQDIIRDDDYPKTKVRNPDPIPDSVREQIEINLHKLPEPIARMWIIAFFTAMRPSELALLKKDCLVQEGSHWSMVWQRGKNSDIHSVPITRIIAKVVQEQQEYIEQLWGIEWNYLFCHYQRPSRNKQYHNIIPVKKVIPRSNSLFRGAIEYLIEIENIRDENGKLAKFSPCLIRHTRLTQLFEQGHDLSVVSAWAGHKYLATTSTFYTQVSCELIEKEAGHIQRALFNANGQYHQYESLPKSFWKDPQAHKLDLPGDHINTPIYGYCGLPLNQRCDKFRACYTCGNFVAVSQKLPQYIKTRDELRAKESRAKASGQDVLVEQFGRQADHKLLNEIGGTAKLGSLVNRTVSAVNIDRYALIVLNKYQRRQLVQVGHEIVELGYDTTTELETIFDTSEEKIFNLTTNKQDKFQPKPINQCLANVFNKIEKGSSPAYPTGLTDLDSLISGLIKQDLIVVAARPSMGKSWLGCYLANYIAQNENKPVVFFSAEMSEEQVTKRFLSIHTGIDSQRLMHNQIYEDEYDTLVEGLGNLAELPIIIDDTPASELTPTRIRSVLRRISSEKGELGLVVLDYIQKLGDRAAGNRAQAIGKYSGACKDIAKTFNTPFVVLAQINRGVEGQSNKRPSMADIKDSGDIEQDMDLGLLLYRDEYYNSDTNDKGIMEIIVGKNRNGSTGTCKVLFKPSIGAFGGYIN